VLPVVPAHGIPDAMAKEQIPVGVDGMRDLPSVVKYIIANNGLE
jgi:hypothetical protein